MEFIVGWSAGGILLCVMLCSITVLKRKHIEQQNAEQQRLKEQQKRLKEQRHLKFLEKIKSNREHLPSIELPEFSPDWAAADEFIMKTEFSFMDEGYRFAYWDTFPRVEMTYIPKSSIDSDTLRLIELLRKDVDWFYSNRTGEAIWEECEVLEKFLREKYRGLSENSISRISSTFCIDNR